MANYVVPGVYSETQPIPPLSIVETANQCVAAIVGTALRGAPNTPVKVNSWSQFCKEFARGYESPYFEGSYLAHCIYNYFQNAGSTLYVIRAIGASAAKASATSDNITFTAVDEGSWGNKIKVSVTQNTDSYVIKVKSTLSGTEDIVETFPRVSNKPADSNFFAKVINSNSKYIRVTLKDTADSYTMPSSTEDLILSGGVDDNNVTAATLSEAFNKGLYELKINILGHTFDGDDYNNAMKLYLADHPEILGCACLPSTTTSDTISTSLEKCAGNISVYHPWVSCTNPLASNLSDIEIPNVGAVMGAISRTITESGIWKAPAGVSVVLRGVNSVKYLSQEDLEEYYNQNINCLVTKNSYGIVIWGARTQSTDENFKYNNAVLLDTFIRRSLMTITEFAVFEPNNEYLWLRVDTVVRGFLDDLWKKGGLAGTTAKEAYSVVCDSTVNTEDVVAEGMMRCNVGYARDIPAEFIVLSFSQKVDNN